MGPRGREAGAKIAHDFTAPTADGDRLYFKWLAPRRGADRGDNQRAR